ncbi:MAG TPA: 2-dehydro-3-deoxy-6-phosphogalactonate aldolase [Sphingomicrobium sp.]|nr:2-dehydro-3-deoxy-6-phosphogalactonate aldolase [Sphingomicrobium sp.]
MSPSDEFRRHFSACPIIAIIRGVRPDEAEAIGAALYDGGIRIIEVPLNSPGPLDSIGRLARLLGGKALIGAGTVLTPADVAAVRQAGGRLIVSPNTNVDVIGATADAGLVSCPGFFSPSEAFAAIRAGATALKFFPAEAGSPADIKALRAVLPDHVPILAVGGIKRDSMQAWREAGADGFGISSALYRPGQTPDETRGNAAEFTAALAE